jgi:hypothetical protein
METVLWIRSFDADPDSTYYLDADANPDSYFYLIRIRIRLFTLMRIWIRIQILASRKG